MQLFPGNLESLTTTAQPISNLPATFQDAIAVALELGIKYIWVDSLCIMQGSDQDWQEQGMQMCDVYANAVVNIMATGVSDNTHSFLQAYKDGTVPPSPTVWPVWCDSDDGAWCIMDRELLSSQVKQNKLLSRGWVFQERYLAPRVLQFGDRQLFWECATHNSCETFPRGLPKYVRLPRYTGFKRIHLANTIIPTSEGSVRMLPDVSLRAWCDLVQAYTRTDLTEGNDKLIAFAGVAEDVWKLYHGVGRQRSNDRYLAGIFERHLLFMLEWYTVESEQKARPLKYRAPTWSWASIDGRVFYDFLPHVLSELSTSTLWKNKHYKSFLPDSCEGQGRTWTPLVTDIDVHTVTTLGDSQFGQVSGGYLKLRGHLSTFESLKTLRNRHPVMITHDISDGAFTSEANDGTSTNLRSLCLPLRCIQVKDHRYRHMYLATGLILKPHEISKSVYVRCGFFCILSSEGVRQMGIRILAIFMQKSSYAATFRMQSLPDIVWANIVDQLRLSFNWYDHIDCGPYRQQSELDGLAALAHLCRTASRLRAIAERAMYSGLPLADTRLRARIFATIRQNPRLLHHVQAAELGDAYMTRDEFVALTLPPNTHGNQQAWPETRIHPSVAEQIGAMRDLPDFSEEFADTWPAYTIALMPNLKKLDITMTNTMAVLPSVFREAAQHSKDISGSQVDPSALHSRPLSQLEEIVIRRVSETKGAVRMQLFEDVLLLPRLKNIYGQCVDLNTNLAARTARQSSSLIHDVLMQSLVEAAGISDLLRTCPLLQTLRIHWGESTVGDVTLEWDGFGHALREYGSNLEVLDLDCRECLTYDMDEWSGNIGTLRELRRLKHLSLPQDVLVGNGDALSGLDNLGDSDEDEGQIHDGASESDVSLEPLLPESLEGLRLYSCYEEEESVMILTLKSSPALRSMIPNPGVPSSPRGTCAPSKTLRSKRRNIMATQDLIMCSATSRPVQTVLPPPLLASIKALGPEWRSVVGVYHFVQVEKPKRDDNLVATAQQLYADNGILVDATDRRTGR
ncbi:hypothetical protein PG996_005009 [Apiospora saccharicola]|uniref:Heterokaryon incompatibility domain-containing protein n=1 Tax=Apiospora saccharicola TaxID=335842 RepID=A0ABR1VN06_9PEZI